jgi:hypothetical protein
MKSVIIIAAMILMGCGKDKEVMRTCRCYVWTSNSVDSIYLEVGGETFNEAKNRCSDKEDEMNNSLRKSGNLASCEIE